MNMTRSAILLASTLFFLTTGCGPGGGSSTAIIDFLLLDADVPVGSGDIIELKFSVNPPDDGSIEFEEPNGDCEGPAGEAAGLWEEGESVRTTVVDNASTTTTLNDDGHAAAGNCTGAGPNGNRQGIEECDDDNSNDNDACTNECTAQCIGNARDNVVGVGEECDDGNNQDADECDNRCLLQSYLEASVSLSGKLTVSVVDRRGIEPSLREPLVRCSYKGPTGADPIIRVESCFTRNGGVCSANVVEEIVVSVSTTTTSSTTTTTSEETECGDGVVEGDEECDDDNTSNADGCSSTCEDQCANGAPDGNDDTDEECDDGNSNDTDDCTNECRDN